MAATVRVLVVDDSPDDRARLSRILKGKRGLRLQVVPPPSILDARDLAGWHPDVAVIDYQLTEREHGREPATFKGSTLAAALREKLPEIPIVLITRQYMVSTGRFAAARDLQGAFDELVMKEAIYKDSDEFAATLIHLAKGFRTLRSCRPRNWKSLQAVLKADDLEQQELLRADPPPEVLAGHTWRVSEVARWILDTVLRYPGIIYDSLHAAVALGLSRESFLKPSVQAFFKTALFRGVFAPSDPHFWKTRMLTKARALLRETHMPDAAFTDFAKAWRRRHGTVLAPAVCNTSEGTPADSVCYILREPVLRRFSLPYHPDTRPLVMDEARVSFKAIRKDNRYDERLFPPDARPLLDAIQRGDNLQ